MNERKREYFDRQVEWILAQLPQAIIRILEEVPLHVEDQPTKSLLLRLRLTQKLKIEDKKTLCSVLSGTPYGKTSKYFGTHAYLPKGISIPHGITIFRRGIVAASRDEEGKVRRDNLRQQIHSIILRELARLHGMNEKEIASLQGVF